MVYTDLRELKSVVEHKHTPYNIQMQLKQIYRTRRQASSTRKEKEMKCVVKKTNNRDEYIKLYTPFELLFLFSLFIWLLLFIIYFRCRVLNMMPWVRYLYQVFIWLIGDCFSWGLKENMVTSVMFFSYKMYFKPCLQCGSF